MLEVDDPKVNIVFHMMAPLESLTPHLDSPLADHNVLLRKLAKEDLERCKELHVNEGFTLKNLEANCKYLAFSTNFCLVTFFDRKLQAFKNSSN